MRREQVGLAVCGNAIGECRAGIAAHDGERQIQRIVLSRKNPVHAILGKEFRPSLKLAVVNRRHICGQEFLD
jgi:hypothetical protein